MGRVRVLFVAAGAAVAVGARWHDGEWGEVRSWLLDLAVGVVYLGLGVATVDRHRPAGVLLWLTGVAWCLGTFTTALLYLHRAPLLHLTLAYPSGRPRRRIDVVAVALAYLTALVTPIWADATTALVLSLLLLAVVVRQYAMSTGGERPLKATALRAMSVVTAAVAGAALITLATSSTAASAWRLTGYELSLVVVGFLMAAPLGARRTAMLTDLVIEVDPSSTDELRSRFAEVLDDPDVRFGLRDGEGTYRSGDGLEVRVPTEGGARRATVLRRGDEPFAVLVHDASTVDDPALIEAITAAARLTADHVALTATLARQMDELAASRRRLLIAADGERRRLEARLRAGVLHDVACLASCVRATAEAATGKTGAHLHAAADHLDLSVGELEHLARGLHPRELELGLGAALEALIGRSPVPVELRVAPELEQLRMDAHGPDSALLATLYYVCAEALTNVAKHAQAHTARVTVTAETDEIVVTVADDGVGLGSMRMGSGLRGLDDRVGALGGSLTVSNERDRGTRLEARFAPAVAGERTGRSLSEVGS